MYAYDVYRYKIREKQVFTQISGFKFDVGVWVKMGH